MSNLTAHDVADIHGLLAKYCWAFDTGDGDAYADNFTPDGTMEGQGHKFQGPDELAAFAAKSFPSTLATQHWNGNILLDATDDGVVGRCYMFGVVQKDGQLSVGVIGYYDDLIVRTDAGWRFQRRRFSRWNADKGQPSAGELC